MVIAFDTASAPPTTASLAEIALLSAGASSETTPRQAAGIDDFAALLPLGTRVNVTFLPGADVTETILTAKRLKADGMVPVPHLPARFIAGPRALDALLARLADEVTVDEVMVVAGGGRQVAGAFDDSMALLASGLLPAHGIRRIAVAGHPEGSPDIPMPKARDALLWKNDFAARHNLEMYVVTQFSFDADVVIDWEREMRAAGNELPIHLGLAGPASVKTLLTYAKTCGVGPSLRVLTRQMGNLTRLLTVRTPDEMLQRIARHKADDPDCLIRAVHVFPFGGMAKTAAWLAEARAAGIGQDAGAVA